MSQYPYLPPQPPYTPPGVPYYGAWPDALRPARTAALLTLILGIIVLLSGTCIGLLGTFFVSDSVLQQLRDQGMKLPPAWPGWTLTDMIRVFMEVISVITLIIGILLIALSFFVRRGGRGACIASICVTGAVGLFSVLNLLGAISQMAGNPIALLLPLIVHGSLIALCVATIVKLLAASRSARAAQAAQMQQQAQHWMASQPPIQPPGYGYGYNVPPPQQNYPQQNYPQQNYPPPPSSIPPQDPPKTV